MSQLGDLSITQQLADKADFDDESTLIAVFERGSDEALCNLVNVQRNWVRQNLHKIIDDALRMGNLRLMLKLQDEFGQLINLTDYQTLLMHTVAEDEHISLPDQLRDALKLDDNNSPGGKTLLHLAAMSGHFMLVPRLLSSGSESKSEVNSQDSSNSSPLLVAARKGHFTIVKQLLAAGADTNLGDKDGQTPMHAASFGGYFDIVTTLLYHGAMINSKDSQDKTPLHRSLENGHTAVSLAILERARYLAERQHDAGSYVMVRYHRRMNENDHRGSMILRAAEGNDRVDIALALIREEESMTPLEGRSTQTSPTVITTPSETILITSSSVNVVVAAAANTAGIDTKDEDGLTPLLLAVKGNHISTVKALVELGANVNQTCPAGDTSLHYAAKLGFNEVLLELLAVKTIEVSLKNEQNSTPLHSVAYWGHVRVVEKLLEKGAELDVESFENLTPLGKASQSNKVEVVKMLLPYATPKQVDDAYFQAIRNPGSKPEAVKLLLEAGATIDLLKDTGTALHHAAFMSFPKVMQILLIRRASLDIRDCDKRTPLLDAARRDSVECVELLVQAGADVNAEDENGRTPLFEAASNAYTSCVRILINANAQFKIPSNMSDRYGSYIELALCEFGLEVFRMVIDKASNESISHKLPVSSKVLRRYLENEDCEISKIRILLDKGLDINQQIGSHGTMLHYAAVWSRLNLAEMLTEPDRVLDLNPNNKEHGTPLETAARKAEVDIVKLLLTRGASVKIGSQRYGSPLHGAANMPDLFTSDWDNAETRYLAIARLILDSHPATINLKAGVFGTPLQAAVEDTGASMLELLLDRSPDYDIRGGIWGTFIHAATYSAQPRMIDLILSKSEGQLTPATADDGGRIALHIAAMEDYDFLIDRLVGEGSSFLTRDFEGRHSLHFAAGGGSIVFAQCILNEHKDAVHDIDADGWTPLHWACRQSYTPMIEFLIEQGADKEAMTHRGWKPFHVALYHRAALRHPDEVIKLVKPNILYVEEISRSALVSELPEDDEEERLPVKAVELALIQDESNTTCDSCQCVSISPRQLDNFRY